MIKKEIVSLVRQHLNKIDKTKMYHERVLIAECEKVLNEMYHQLYQTKPRLLDNYTKTYGADTAIAISQESNSNIYYSTLPANIVNLPCKSSGVLHIYPVAQTGNIFVPMDSTEADILFNSDVAVVTDRIGFRARQDSRVDYWNMTSAILATGVRMDLLIPFSVYADTDVVNIPEFGEKEGGTFLQRVLTALAVIPPTDLLDNNAVSEQPTNNKR